MSKVSKPINLMRAVPTTKKNYVHPWLRARVRWHHRHKKEDFRTLDKRNQENSTFLCRLIEYNRFETTSYVSKWTTIIGNRVLDLAFLGPEVEEAKKEIEDIFFLRYNKQRQYHIDKLYQEIVPQLEYVDGELIQTYFLGLNDKKRIRTVTEFANTSLPAFPLPEECYQERRMLTYPELLVQQQRQLASTLNVSPTAAVNTATEMLALLPEARFIQAQRVQNTQLDFEGETLAWQAERIQQEIHLFQKRYDKQMERNASVKEGEQTHTYKKVQTLGYRIPGDAHGPKVQLKDYNLGYDTKRFDGLRKKRKEPRET